MEIFSSAGFWITVFAVMSIMAFIGYMVENTEFAKRALSKDLLAPRRKVQEVRKPLSNMNEPVGADGNMNAESVSSADTVGRNNIGAMTDSGAQNMIDIPSSISMASNQDNVPHTSIANSFNELPQIYTDGDIDPLNVNDSMDPWAVGGINDLNLSDKPDIWNVGEINKLKVKDPDYEPNTWTDTVPQVDTRMETYYNADGNEVDMEDKSDNSNEMKELEFFQSNEEPEVLSFGDDDPFMNKNS